MHKRNGFTIVELLIVVVVMGILAAIVTVAYNGIQNRAKNTRADSMANELMTKAATFRSFYDTYATYDELVGNRLPGSNINGSADKAITLSADLIENLTDDRYVMLIRQKLLIYRKCDQAAISAYVLAESSAYDLKKNVIGDSDVKKQSASNFCL